MRIRICLLLICHFMSFVSTSNKPLLSLDEYFNYTQYSLVDFSPNDEYLLIETRNPLWSSNSFENCLWLYHIQTQKKHLITNKLSRPTKPQWSPSGQWISLLVDEISEIPKTNKGHHSSMKHHIYLFSMESFELFAIETVDTNIASVMTWSDEDTVMYFAAEITLSTKEEIDTYENEWKDVIVHRKPKLKRGTAIYQMDLNLDNQISLKEIRIVTNVSFVVGELLFVATQRKFIMTSVSYELEELDNSEIYSVDLDNVSSLTRLTNNEVIENDLHLSSDSKKVLFQYFTLSSSNGMSKDTQIRLYSIDFTNGRIERLVKDFNGSIAGYVTNTDGSVFIVGQQGIEVQVYSQQSLTRSTVKRHGWSGTYESIRVSKSPNPFCSIAFIYSSLKSPKEVYCASDIDRLAMAKSITNGNDLWNERSLPDTKVFHWKSAEDNRTIEGILHYPPGHFEGTNMPLFVLIHGGPYDASLNQSQGNGYSWATLAASYGWLVLEPNYRGSTGYGDQYLAEVRYQPLVRPGIDILSGVDHLINDGIADRHRLCIGGYSFGSILTNWLITQTDRFNAAVSGAGTAEHVSMWGTMDWPVHINYLMGGFPWEVPHVYQSTGPMYYLDRVRTPTLLVTGGNDVRVPTDQSYMFERGLYTLRVPVQLLVFPNEGHSVINSKGPWYGKIKVREELKWLQAYGHQSHMTKS